MATVIIRKKPILKNISRKPKSHFLRFNYYEKDAVRVINKLIDGWYAKGISIHKLSLQSNLSYTCVHNLFYGKTMFPRLDTIWKLYRGLNMTTQLPKKLRLF